jgi:hypothetical protein
MKHLVVARSCKKMRMAGRGVIWKTNLKLMTMQGGND